MSNRFWFYLGIAIIIAGEVTFYLGQESRQANDLARLDRVALEEQHQNIKQYLVKQTDERKLVSLAKNLPNADQTTLQLIIDRAYEINPNSRDITLLASYFHPELKKRVKELDPLYELED